MANAQCISPAKAHAAGAPSRARSKASSSSHTTQEGTSIGKRIATGAKESITVNINTAAPRSLDVAMAEVRYGVVFGEMNEVFNGRLHRMLLFVSKVCTLAGATGGAFGGVLHLAKLATSAEVAAIISLCVGCVAALVTACMFAFKLDDRAKEFKKARDEFYALEGQGWSMSIAQLDKKLAELRAKAPSGGSWIAPLAYNKACEQLGHPDAQMEVRGCRRLVAGFL